MKLKTSKLICIKKCFKVCNFCSQRGLRQFDQAKIMSQGKRKDLFEREIFCFLNSVLIGITEQIIKIKLLKLFFSNTPFLDVLLQFIFLFY